MIRDTKGVVETIGVQDMSFLFSLVLLNSCPYIYIRNFSYPSLNLHPFLILKMFNFKLNYFTIQ